jgi:UDP-N-acetylglucosamine--N-acetylmuramyl-(pentapeptide) pyrophosphoryl-undecaprenol N-acetylglucosamine transferase
MSIRILRAEKPSAILGMGGFTSVPIIISGVLLGIPGFLHEQNVQPGLANKFLSKCTKGTFISFERTKKYLSTKKTVHTGNPLRKGLAKDGTKKQEGTFGIFIFGGSRGARSINDAVIALLPYLENYRNTIIFHQTGQDDFERVNAVYKNTSLSHEVFSFTNEMERYYSMSDVVISRAGATTIFELAYFNKPAILIPYPYSAGGHQWKNASEVENIGGAHVIANEEATGERLFHAIKHLMNEPQVLKEMGENIGKIYVSDAAERIIGGIRHGLS